MRTLTITTLAIAGLFGTVQLSGCRNDRETVSRVEHRTERVEDDLDEVGDDIEDSVDNAGDELEEVGDEIEDEID